MEKLLKEKDEEYVRQLFEQNLKDPVELVLFLEKEDGERLNHFNEQYQPYIEEIAKEISSISDKVKLTVHKGNLEKEKEYGVKNISALFVEGKNTNKMLFTMACLLAMNFLQFLKILLMFQEEKQILI